LLQGRGSRPYDGDVNNRTETKSLESDAEPAAVLAVPVDPTRIPEWAPEFADVVAGNDQCGWLARRDGRQFTVRVVPNRQAGTVDYLREIAPGREGGAFLRVVPRPGGGSVVVMTVPLAPGAEPAAAAATLRDELNVLNSLANSS
jgi:hypothetical protein